MGGISISYQFINKLTACTRKNNMMGRRRLSSQLSWFVALVVVIESSCALVGAKLAGRTPTTYNVLKYGAVGNGRRDDTKAFVAAWNATCSDAGSPTLLVPRGKTFMVGQLELWGQCNSPVHVQVDGNVVRPNKKWKDAASWIQFISIDGLTIDGNGQLDGTGHIYWLCKAKRTCKVAPNTLVLLGIKNLDLSGLKFRNSCQFHIALGWCNAASVHHLTIEAPEDSPNTDGIHIDTTHNLQIWNNIIGTGDDCISIGNGSININVNNIICGPGHGISIGSLGKSNSEAQVEKIKITNSYIFDADNGLRIKTWQGGSGYAREILYKNIVVRNVRRPILIDQYYCPFQVCKPKSSAVKISDVRYMNVRGTSSSEVAVTLNCSASVPCTGIHMDAIYIRHANKPEHDHVDAAAAAARTTSSVCTNAYGTKRGTLVPHVPCLKPTFLN